MRKGDNLRAWELLLLVHKLGSITRAAARIGVSAAAATKIIDALEEEIGLKILDREHRPVRALADTPELFRQIDSLVLAKRRTDLALASLARNRLQGAGIRTIRVSIPLNYNRQQVLSFLFDFEQRHPHVKIDIQAEGGLEGLLAGETDVAFVGFMPQEEGVHSLFVRKNINFLMASRRYEELHGLPQTIEELPEHRLYIRSSTNRTYTNTLVCGSRTFTLEESANLIHADADTCRSALLASRGIALDMDLGFVLTPLASGMIVPVLPGWHRKPWTDTICCPKELARDPVIAGLMAEMKRAMLESQLDKWQFWYRRLGLPMDSVAGEEDGKAEERASPSEKRTGAGSS